MEKLNKMIKACSSHFQDESKINGIIRNPRGRGDKTFNHN